ncbi:Protein TusC [Candidatus Erwinia haradaeae]|uniref:Protein TusC n=2 Tax=Candidatus Erwinia haradaeae TaxID=1922217 RepID=A0A451D9R4_9GAMM|nr:sulfurtransferase complex subunit TusC [Candidatus Erwinia haradaeae]VFP83012.1 Protein TusC [Candidatus Erwinia haradaeae]
MHSIAFVFTKSPHGSSAGREGLDAVLATLTLSNHVDVGLFFVSDGVLQLLKYQNSDEILARNYSPTFGILSLYDVKCLYVCSEALLERGILCDHTCIDQKYILKAQILSAEELRVILHQYDRVMTF